MKKHENYADVYKYIKDGTDFSLPETLSSDNIAKTVASVRVQPKKRYTARYVSIAAALVVVTLAGIVGFRLTNAPQKGGVVSVPKMPQSVQTAQEAEDEYLRTASYEEIESFFLDKQKTYRTKSYADDMAVFGGNTGLFNDKAATPESSAVPGISGVMNSGTDSIDYKLSTDGTAHGETNTQVDGIDEADILKNDGNYLYIARAQQSTVEIVDIRDPKNMQTTAQIDRTAETETRTVRELYVYGDTLVLLCDVYAHTENSEKSLYDVCYAYVSENMKTVAEIYDISDRTAPRLRFDYAVDGGQISSRMDGSTLLLITSYTVPIYKNADDMKNACVPCTYQEGEKVRFPAENVRIVSGTESTAYLTVSRLDTQADKAEAQTKAVLGGGSEIYCDGENLLVAQADYTALQNETDTARDVAVSSAAIGTRLYTFDIKSGVAYKGSAQVKGTTLNQFSMDSFGGYYRIATTASDGSLITVLNKNLDLVGELRGIAKGESIYAARFMGDTAYLVTFYQTDPLFVIDLSDPAAPKVTGELKIPGFSNYLHPYAENLLIGIGQDGTAVGANNRLKISLFDVSDRENPKEISKAVYNGGSASMSAAQNTHKAFLSVRTSGEFAVPVQEIFYSDTANNCYASMLTVQDGKLCITGTYTPKHGDAEIERVTYVGDTVFTFSENALTAFDKGTGEILSEIVYNNTGNVVIK